MRELTVCLFTVKSVKSVKSAYLLTNWSLTLCCFHLQRFYHNIKQHWCIRWTLTPQRRSDVRIDLKQSRPVNIVEIIRYLLYRKWVVINTRWKTRQNKKHLRNRWRWKCCPAGGSVALLKLPPGPGMNWLPSMHCAEASLWRRRYRHAVIIGSFLRFKVKYIEFSVSTFLLL